MYGIYRPVRSIVQHGSGFPPSAPTQQGVCLASQPQTMAALAHGGWQVVVARKAGSGLDRALMRVSQHHGRSLT